MSTELIINSSLPETRIALMENGEIQELLVERASGKGIVGNIYKGRVTRVLPGMQAAFVDIGLEKAAFLYVDDVFVHSEIWEAEEGAAGEGQGEVQAAAGGEVEAVAAETPAEQGEQTSAEAPSEGAESGESPEDSDEGFAEETPAEDFDESDFEAIDPESDEDDDSGEPVAMGAGPGGDDDGAGNKSEQPSGTVAPISHQESAGQDSGDHEASQGSSEDSAEGGEGGVSAGGETSSEKDGDPRRKHRRGRRGGRNRKREGAERGGDQRQASGQKRGAESESDESSHETFEGHVADEGSVVSDRAELGAEDQGVIAGAGGADGELSNRPQEASIIRPVGTGGPAGAARPEFREQRSRDKRIKSKSSQRPPRGQVNIQDLLKEGQEVLVQVAKDPIATKGARLTCHISLPGRHLVCMPTIDHVGVSRRIERDDERRKLREHVEKFRPKNMGFIVRTASGKQQSEKRIKQDIDYLTRLWEEIRQKSAEVTAPAMVYEDLNSVLRSIRDWVNEEIDKIMVDSRYHYNDIQRFVAHFMPSLRQKVELYHGDIPIFDAYGISTELSRALERKVWLKSGGYIVVDQAEALVAIDVNTGRFVGKKNLEDTILKTNLEAVQEIAYQLRLRNCGGIIILDLIDMEREENKQRVYRALEEALKKDRARPTILKISELGLIEMTRKRTRDTMVRSLCESCAHCEGKGFVKSKQTVAYEVLREVERAGIDRDTKKILVQANADVIDVLAIDERDTLDQLERRYRKQIYLQAVTDFHGEQFEVSSDRAPGAVARLEQPRRQDRRPERQERDEQKKGERGRRGRGQSQSQGQGQGQGSNPNPQQARGQGVVIKPAGTVIIAPVAVPVAGAVAGSSTEPSEFDPSEQRGNFGVAGEGGQSLAEGDAGQGRGPNDDGFFETEEDRLAFLRAQAAQDAALSGVGASAQGQGRGPGARHHAGRDPQGGGSGGANNRRRGRRGSGGSGGGGGGGGGKFRGPRQGQGRGASVGGHHEGGGGSPSGGGSPTGSPSSSD